MNTENLPSITGAKSNSMAEAADKKRAGFVSWFNHMNLDDDELALMAKILATSSAEFWLSVANPCNFHAPLSQFAIVAQAFEQEFFLPEDIPALLGTEKQVAWASEIRAKFIRWNSLAKRPLIESIVDRSGTGAFARQEVAAYDELDRLYDAAAGIGSATFWIENRDEINRILVSPGLNRFLKQRIAEALSEH